VFQVQVFVGVLGVALGALVTLLGVVSARVNGQRVRRPETIAALTTTERQTHLHAGISLASLPVMFVQRFLLGESFPAFALVMASQPDSRHVTRINRFSFGFLFLFFLCCWCRSFARAHMLNEQSFVVLLSTALSALKTSSSGRVGFAHVKSQGFGGSKPGDRVMAMGALEGQGLLGIGVGHAGLMVVLVQRRFVGECAAALAVHRASLDGSVLVLLVQLELGRSGKAVLTHGALELVLGVVVLGQMLGQVDHSLLALVTKAVFVVGIAQVMDVGLVSPDGRGRRTGKSAIFDFARKRVDSQFQVEVVLVAVSRRKTLAAMRTQGPLQNRFSRVHSLPLGRKLFVESMTSLANVFDGRRLVCCKVFGADPRSSHHLGKKLLGLRAVFCRHFSTALLATHFNLLLDDVTGVFVVITCDVIARFVALCDVTDIKCIVVCAAFNSRKILTDVGLLLH